MKIQDLDHGLVVPVEDGDEHVAPASKPQPLPTKTKPKMVSLRQMFRFATWWDYLLLTVGAICATANGGAMAAFSVILGTIFDTLTGPNPGDGVGVSMLFVYLACAMFVTAGLQFATFTSASERMTIRLRQEYLDAVLKQDIAFFDDSALSGSLSSQVAENSLMFREALGDKLASLFQFGSMFIGGLAVGFTYLYQLALVILAVAPLLAICGFFMAKVMTELVSGQLDSYAVAGSIAEESFTLIRTVTAFGMQNAQVSKYNKELERSALKQTEQGRAFGLGFGCTMFVYFGSYALALYVGALLITNSKVEMAQAFPLAANGTVPSYCQVGGEIPLQCQGTVFAPDVFETVADVCNCISCNCGCWGGGATASRCTSGGDVLLTFFAVLIGSFAIGQAAPAISAITNGRVAAHALYRVLDRKPLIDATDDSVGEKPTKVRGEICFEHVRFAYPTRMEAEVFTDLNLVIPAGKRVALVGESGSGKSTCIGLIERYYDPLAGRVTLDGMDLRDINVKHLRSLIGLVSQEPILFGTSIMENVRFGLPGATDEQVVEACKQANAHEFICTFPEAYKTFVNTSLVSGGQKQRIAIARALLRNPPILLLDEATAALDNESERLVNQAIDRLLAKNAEGEQQRTTIVIAHRLSSIKACDEIIVLERGKVVERGSHNELVSHANGLYASLVKLSEGSGTAGQAREEEQGKESEVVQVDDPFTAPPPVTAGSVVPEDKALEEVVDEVQEKKKKRNYPIRWAFRYAYAERWFFLPAVFASAINGLVFPIFALLFSNLLDTFYYPNNTDILHSCSMWSFAFLGLATCTGLANFVQHYTFGFINGRLTKRLRAALFAHALSMEIGFFDLKENNVGSLSSKLASDAALVRAAICDRLALAVSNFATAVAGFTIAFVASYQISLVVFAMFPVLVLSGALEMYVMAGMALKDQTALEGAAETLNESINGVRTVSAFGMQPAVRALYFSQLQGPLAQAQRKGVIAGLGYGLSQAIMFFAYALTFWYGSSLVAAREVSFKDMNQALFGILMTAMALGQAMAMSPDIAKGQAAVNSVFETLERQSRINAMEEEEGKLQPSVFLGDLTFENIRFAYPSRPNVTVLENFNLSVKRGQTVAFVGTSGSGKSTLVLLLERFYDAMEGGSVKIDGVDVRELSVRWLREQIGIVSQEPALFRGTIMENIRNGKLDATDEECIEAAKMANAHEFIMKFPQAYDTDLQTAQGVSGGQKQRVAIARALVRNPKLLLLDEATSALDEESQRVVQQALDKLLARTSRTTIVVAHRLSTIRNADLIVVLQHGVVVEQGSFEELANRPHGAFQALLKAQANQQQQH